MINPGATVRLGRLWLCVLGVLQCSDVGGLEQELARSLTIVPDTVVAGDTLRAILLFENASGRAITMTGLYACPAFLYTFRGSTEVELEGSKFACPSTVTEFRVESRNSLTVNHILRARVRPPGTSEAYSAAPAGSYRLKADLNMSLPDLEATFVVLSASPALSAAAFARDER